MDLTIRRVDFKRKLLYIVPGPANVDWYVAIRELHEEKKRLDRLIAALEAIENGQNPDKTAGMRRRGRKNMSPEERQQVSERMRRYWAGRRNGVSAAPESPDDSGASF